MQRHEVDWDNERDVVDFVTDKWEHKDTYKRNLEKSWLEIIAAYEGFSHLNYHQIEQQMVQNFNIPSWRVKLTINLLLPYVRTGAAKHLRNRPIWDVVPATDDNQDIMIASAGKKVLRGYWYNRSVNYQFMDILLWLGLTGNAFAYIPWNPDGGPNITLKPEDFIDANQLQAVNSPEAIQQLLADAQGKFKQFTEERGTDKIPAGDVEFDVPTPFDLVFPHNERFTKVPWLVHGQIRDRSFYIDMGFKEEDFSKPTTKDARFVHYARRVNNLMFFGGGSADEGQLGLDVDEADLLELRLWMPKSAQKGLQEGRFVTVAGGKLIVNTLNPYKDQEMPYVKFTAERTPGKIWGFSAASQVLPLVREHQKNRSQIIEAKNLMSKPKWLVSRSSRILETAITSEPGEVIEYSGLIKPEAHHPPSMPRYVFDLDVLNQKDMDAIMAQRDATKGVNPPGGRSGTMLENLQSQDDGQLALIGLDLDTGMSTVGRKILSRYSQFVAEDRLITFTGEKNRLETVLLKQGSLVGVNENVLGADYHNVRVTQFSQFGLTRTGQFEVLKTLLQFNVFEGPKSRTQVLKFINMGFFEEEIDEFKADRSNAHIENLMMLRGQPLKPGNNIQEAFGVDLSDDDTTHMDEHVDYMKGDDYRTADPQIKFLYQFHLQQHKLYQVLKVIEPQVLAIKAQFLAAALNQIPQELLNVANQQEQGANGASTGGASTTSGSGRSSGSSSTSSTSGNGASGSGGGRTSSRTSSRATA